MDNIMMKYKVITGFKASPTLKLIYGYILDTGEKEIVLSLKTIASHLKLSKRAVINNINKLCKLGVIRKIPRVGNDGARLSNKYIVN